MSEKLYDIMFWGGQSSLIQKEKLPVAFVQALRNGILSKRLGVIKKRPRYANVLTSGTLLLAVRLAVKSPRPPPILPGGIR